MAIVPTMSTVSHLKNPSEIIPYVLRHFARAPAKTLSVFTNQEISLQDILSKYDHDRELVIDPIQIALRSTFSRIFPDSTPLISVTTAWVNEEAGTYDIFISVQLNIDGQVYSITNSITVEDGILKFTVTQ